jgi:tRNA-dihydrouridine synthase B
MTFQLGTIKLEPCLSLAPMAGITSHPFRILAKEQGCNLLFSEMISAKGLLFNNKRNQSLLYFTEEEKPIGLQIFGSEPEIMAAAARKLEKLGADIIDLNLGCPARKVTRNGEGGALLRQPQLCSAIFKAVVGVVSCPVTVKLRIGWDEQSKTLSEIAIRAEEDGIKALTVHGRTVEQGYSGRANWSKIKQVKELVSIPVIGNGDVDSPQTALQLLKETSCDGIMVGRAARGNPWIFNEILAILAGRSLPARPTIDEIIATILKHFRLLIDLKGEAAAVREMRRLSCWYIKGLPGSAAARQKLIYASSFSETESLLQQVFKKTDD